MNAVTAVLNYILTNEIIDFHHQISEREYVTMTNKTKISGSVAALYECIELQEKKSNDYQNPNSRIRQADYFPNGIQSIHDICNIKMLRLQSVMEAMQSPDFEPNFESLEDSAKDLINYASFMVAYMRQEMDGQTPGHDFLNRPVEV